MSTPGMPSDPSLPVERPARDPNYRPAPRLSAEELADLLRSGNDDPEEEDAR